MSDKKVYGHIGKEIADAFSEGLHTGNYSSLNDAISSSVDAILGDVGEKLVDGARINGQQIKLSRYRGGYSNGADTRARQERLQEERLERQEAAATLARERNRNNARRMKNNPNGLIVSDGAKEIMVPFRNAESSSSVISSVVGGVGLGITTLAGISGIPGWIAGGSLGGVVVAMIFACGFGFMLWKGRAQSKRRDRAKRYAQLCGTKQYIEIDYLASSTGQTPKKVVKDIKKMLSSGYFPQGHLDNSEKTFIISDEVYRQYIETDRNSSIHIINGQTVIDTTARDVNDDNPELTAMINEGNEYIRRLHELNDDIPGEGISFKLDRLETLLREIFTRIEATPEQMPRMQEMMEYYLPTMIKLVEAYADYDKISEPDEDVLSAKIDIENTLDTINGAFTKLLSILFKDSVWDVTTDAQVLKTMLVQKGLADNMETSDKN